MKKQLSPVVIAIVVIVTLGVVFGALWAMSEAPTGKAEDFEKKMPGAYPPAGTSAGNPAPSGKGKADTSKSAPASGGAKSSPPGS